MSDYDRAQGIWYVVHWRSKGLELDALTSDSCPSIVRYRVTDKESGVPLFVTKNFLELISLVEGYLKCQSLHKQEEGA